MNIGMHSIAAMILMATIYSKAQAAPIYFLYDARVTYSDGSLSGISVGTLFRGTFGYEALSSDSNPNPNFATYRFGPNKYIEAKIAGHDIIAGNLYIDLANDFGGNVEDSVVISGSSPRIDGTSYSNGSFSLTLASKSGNTGVFPSDALPTNYDVHAFDAIGFRNGGLRRDGGSSGAVLNFDVVNISRLPEPSTLSVALFGLGLVGALAYRRKTKNLLASI